MYFFAGCALIAVVIWYVGKKIARVLFAISAIIEHAAGKDGNWPNREYWDTYFGNRR